MTTRLIRTLAGGAALALGLSMAACGSDDDKSGGPPSYPGARAQDLGRFAVQSVAGDVIARLRRPVIETSVTAVAYQGTGPAMNDMLGGRVDLMCDQVTNTSSQITAGSIQAYCVTTKSRVPALPAVPSCSEAGLPGFEASVWHGLYAPKSTPQPVLQALNEALKAALRSDLVKKRLGDLGTEPVPPQDVTPEALRAQLESQIDKWGKVVKAARIPLE